LFNRDNNEVPPLYEDATGQHRSPNIYLNNQDNSSQLTFRPIELENQASSSRVRF
jgi:hypothetical protein